MRIAAMKVTTPIGAIPNTELYLLEVYSPPKYTVATITGSLATLVQAQLHFTGGVPLRAGTH